MKAKNIGLVTWLGGANFGTVLQAYALQTALKEEGCRVVCMEEHGPLWSMKHALNGFLEHFGLHIREKEDPVSLRMMRVRAFQNETFERKIICGKTGIPSMRRWADAFVCGSDQIWNTYNYFSPFLFLDFAGKRKRIAYAPSLGTKGIRPGYEEKVRKLVNDFESVSVREKSGAGILSELTGRNDIKCVLDPSLLVSSHVWEDLAEKSQTDCSDRTYILCYLLRRRDDYDDILATIRNITGISDVIVVPAMENPDISIEGSEIYPDAGPAEFVRLVRDASLVVTDSFHGIALSLSLGRDFVPLKRFDDRKPESQNSRITDLLESVGLGEMLPSEGFILQKVDYTKVSARLQRLREESREYLKTALDV